MRAIHLPGRETRLREPPFTRAEDSAEAITDALEERLDLPFAFFGHSMGALLSFEVARCPATTWATGAPVPFRVGSPGTPGSQAATSRLPSSGGGVPGGPAGPLRSPRSGVEDPRAPGSCCCQLCAPILRCVRPMNTLRRRHWTARSSRLEVVRTRRRQSKPCSPGGCRPMESSR